MQLHPTASHGVFLVDAACPGNSLRWETSQPRVLLHLTARYGGFLVDVPSQVVLQHIDVFPNISQVDERRPSVRLQVLCCAVNANAPVQWERVNEP